MPLDERSSSRIAECLPRSDDGETERRTAGATMIELQNMTPAAREGWAVLFALAEEDDRSWLLIGGQMMHLLAVELGAAIIRPTDDVDVVVNVRTRPAGTEWLSGWLLARGFESAGISAENIAHRFVRAVTPGPGAVVFDVLGPEGLGSRSALYTLRPARTVQVPGSVQAFQRSALVDVGVTDIGGVRAQGRVRRPSPLGALIAKAAATRIVGRDNRQRDWQDAALLLSVIDPFAVDALTKKDRQRLALLEPLADEAHAAWRPFDAAARRTGRAALTLLRQR